MKKIVLSIIVIIFATTGGCYLQTQHHRMHIAHAANEQLKCCSIHTADKSDLFITAASTQKIEKTKTVKSFFVAAAKLPQQSQKLFALNKFVPKPALKPPANVLTGIVIKKE